jgi:hypothetical protein
MPRATDPVLLSLGVQNVVKLKDDEDKPVIRSFHDTFPEESTYLNCTFALLVVVKNPDLMWTSELFLVSQSMHPRIGAFTVLTAPSTE